MVQVLPGPEEILGPAFQQLTQGLMHYINPNREFQRSMQQAVAKNPELLQQLANAEAAAPGILGSLGLGQALTGTISKMPESADAKFARENKDQIAATKEIELDLAGEAAKSKLRDMQDMADFIKDNPDIRGEELFRRMYGMTRAGKKIEEANVTTAQSGARVATATEGARIRQGEVLGLEADITYQALENVRAKMPELAGINIKRAVKDLQAGTIDPKLGQALMMAPGFKDMVNAVIEHDYKEQMLSLQRQQALSRSDKAEDMEARSMETRAYQMWDESKAGSISAWRKYMYELDKSGKRDETIAALRAKPVTELDPKEQDLLEVDDAFKRMNAAKISAHAEQFNTDIRKGLASYGAAKDPTAKQYAVVTIQRTLDAKYGPGKVTVKQGAVPDAGTTEDATWWQWNRDGIYFLDVNGKAIDPMEIETSDTEIVRTNEKLDANEQAQYDAVMRVLNTAPNALERQAALARLKERNPRIYERVNAAMNPSKK